MRRHVIDSRAIREVAYDDATRALEVCFSSGRIYHYADVPREVFEWLLRVPSKGAFFNRMIKDGYAFTEAAEDEASVDPTDALTASLRGHPEEDR